MCFFSEIMQCLGVNSFEIIFGNLFLKTSKFDGALCSFGKCKLKSHILDFRVMFRIPQV